MRKMKLQLYYEKVFSKLNDGFNALPLSNYDSFKLNDEWVSYIRDNKECLLKYGVDLLTFAIKEHKLGLMDDIYKKCINYFKEDLERNQYTVSPQKYHDKLHLYSFEIVNSEMSNYDAVYQHILYEIHPIIFIAIFVYGIAAQLTESIYFYLYFILINITFIANYLYNIDDTIEFDSIFEELSQIFSYNLGQFILQLTRKIMSPTIIFMNPYIKFVNYPKDYNWFWELIKPQPSPFVKTINRDIYKTWNGEALINFKWITYGMYYYTIIWFIFTAFLGCFTAVATIPQQNLDENVKKGLLIVSIIFGLIHLSFEVRQFIYSYSEWIHNYWNFFDLGAYSVPTFTSIYWLCTNYVGNFWLSFSCILLDLKFLLFLRVFESFGVYFAIIVGVAKQIVYFLVILLIIIISFAHAFLIILRPRLDYSLDQPITNNDPNNPWNLNTTYNQVENGIATQNTSFVQAPDENTNMFTDYKTALFAMYLFLTGDTSALTNKWEYKENPALVIFFILFSFLIVIYLMNLFIGLLNTAIEKENNRVSYLVQKAEILAEIELFYMLPHTRRRKDWFPTRPMYYYADIIKTRKKIKELIREGEWKADEFYDMKKNLLELLKIKHEPHETI
ncbi:hypothetical protein RclHR1_01230016 [Rhizophagus clarus]|uniref:Ion transport domain-containing protein n=1 Tax=Rhizophagus clarus TaxID=94130 RepID=A0A2Z6Q6U8_9GLOM|nr:hypothetical protein RclHR1_01230016 [Rhizophagus clarus]